ncbi:TSUP family transporter [Colwellia demingiae]|uniref:Probable membrane transporter protein n=1 Tax=Colwellia demingiae TaxID=89401 RepID=A0A5C6Q6Q1_9GAMM|nr:TSUP family transporter [Colwellia demingiae]
MELSLTLFIGLTVVAFVAGFISSIAGAGGAIVLLVLLWAGLPPLNALATNKFQSVFGTLSSTINFFRKGYIDLHALRPALCYAFVGSMIGTYLVQQISTDYLSIMMPYLLIVIALYMMFSPTITDEDLPPRISEKTFAPLIGGGIGLYGGFFGPGMGSFFAVAFASLRGFNMRKATAFTKPMVLIVNTTSMVIFLWGGHIVWALAITMAASQVVGARLGSNLVIHRGAALIKPFIVLMTLAIAFKLLLESNI